MNIQLEQIFNLEGSKKEFDFCFEPEYSLSDDISLDAPGIAVSGKIENNTGIVSLSGKAKFSATVVCSRCAEDFKRDFTIELEHLLANLYNKEYTVEFSENVSADYEKELIERRKQEEKEALLELEKQAKIEVELAKELLDRAKEKGVKIVLPIDNVGAKDFREDAETKVFNSAFFADDYQGMDIGPKTIKAFKKEIKKARTIVWNGPVGVYEYEPFKHGTNKIAKYVAKSKSTSIIGGGDSIAAIQSLGVAKRVSHISTGGGASLMLLQGQTLPCVELIEDN